MSREPAGQNGIAGPQRFGPGYATQFAPLLDGSASMKVIKAIVEAIADTDATVLIRGESGVGKEVVARAIHSASRRAGQPFVKVNCAALPAPLLESELFGHEKGAFTGAYRRKQGQFEYANGGMLYLDEIGELPLALQPKLLHVLQDFKFFRIGGHEPITADVRILAATNRDLELAMKQGQFREDLYYRLDIIDIHIPPLRERREEIPRLAGLFLATFAKQYQRPAELSPKIMAALMEHPWPGNIRELENFIRRFVLLGERGLCGPLAGRPKEHTIEAQTSVALLEGGLRDIARRGAQDAERKALTVILGRVGWNRVEAARALKVSYKTLLNKIAELELTPPTTPTAESVARAVVPPRADPDEHLPKFIDFVSKPTDTET